MRASEVVATSPSGENVSAPQARDGIGNYGPSLMVGQLVSIVSAEAMKVSMAIFMITKE